MINWAKHEIEIAKNKNNDEYFGMCCDSALKAYETLLNDEHSGFSWGTTVYILNTLCQGKPLSDITDDDFVINEDYIPESPEYLAKHNLKSDVQCPRITSLFRKEYLDGTVKYHDNNRWVAYDEASNFGCHSGLVTRIMDNLYPIKMPYRPESNEVYITEFLTNKKNGDFDTVAIHYVVFEDGHTEKIDKFFKWDDDVDTYWAEISADEYSKRYERKIN